MKKYAAIFTLANFLISLVTMAVFIFLHIEANAGVSIACTLAASYAASAYFVKDMGRAPTPEETRQFSWLALCGAWLSSIVLTALLVAVFFTMSDIRLFMMSLGSTRFYLLFIGIGIIVVSAIYFFSIRWAFTSYPRLALKRTSA